MSNIIPNITISNVNEDYLRGFKDGKKAGATEWAGRAKGLVDALEEITKSPTPANERERDSWMVTARAIAVNALAKYKEATNV